MLPTEQLDMLNYTRAFKGNYRKGPHTLRAILSSPAQGRGFASNLGGVSVIFGVPLGQPDKNSDELLSILTGSKWCDQAVETWLHGFYEFDSLDQLLSDVAVCRELANDPFMFRAVGASGVVVGKTVARLAGLDPSSYADMTAVAANATAMRSVAASSTAMTAVAASSTAMAAIWQSSTALQAVKNNATAWTTFTGASNSVMGKTVAILAGLNPASFADMTAVAASSTAMAAVAASATAIRAVVASSTAKTALIAQNTRLQSVAATWWNTVQSGFTLVRAQRDDDGVTNANVTNASYIVFAIPGGFNNGSGSTNCFHGHNGAAAGSASGSYTDTTKRKILLGGGTFTETNDGMVRTWVYSI